MKKKTDSQRRPWPPLQWLIFFALLCPVWNLTGAGHAAEVVDRIIAVVNNEPISLKDFQQYYKPYADKLAEMGYPQEKTRELDQKLRREKLDQMIDERLAQQQIAKANIRVSEGEINSAIEQVRKMNGYSEEEFRAALQNEKLTMPEYRKRLEEQILRAKLINQEVKSKIVITESDVKDYYDKHPNEFVARERVHLRNIIVPVTGESDDAAKKAAKARIEQVYSRLKAGGAFEALAREYTVASLAGSGGDLGWFDRTSLSSQIQSAIADLKAGEYTRIIDTDKGFQIFQLVEAKGDTEKSLESVFDQIQKKLYDGVVESRYKAWLSGLRSQAHIRFIE